MTDHVARLYAAGATLVAFFLVWAGIAARPWVAPARDPRLAALEQREQRLRRDAALVQQVVARRWAAYRAALSPSDARIAAQSESPSVRVVTVPPVVSTRSS